MEDYKRTVRRVFLIGGKEPVTLLNNINDWLAEHDTQNPRVITVTVHEDHWCSAWVEYDRREV